MSFSSIPLKLRPIPVPRVWGGHRIFSEIHQQLSDAVLLDGLGDQPIGESWELSDVGDDPAFHSKVCGGPAAGRSLRDLIEAEPMAILGENIWPAGSAGSPRLPLLFKYLDARENLSVQVHPSDELVAELGLKGAAGKTEAWLILAAEEGASVIYGLEPGLSYQDYLAQAMAGRGAEGLARVEVRRGDLIYLPAGTLHAICSGVLLAEIQQTSDSTYRIYDWDRMGMDGQPRALHLEEAVRIRPPEPLPPCPFASRQKGIELSSNVLKHDLPDAPFEIVELRPSAQQSVALSTLAGEPGKRFAICSVLEGAGEIAGDNFDPIECACGDVIFLPAGVKNAEFNATTEAWLMGSSPVSKQAK